RRDLGNEVALLEAGAKRRMAPRPAPENLRESPQDDREFRGGDAHGASSSLLVVSVRWRDFARHGAGAPRPNVRCLLALNIVSCDTSRRGGTPIDSSEISSA